MGVAREVNRLRDVLTCAKSLFLLLSGSPTLKSTLFVIRSRLISIDAEDRGADLKKNIRGVWGGVLVVY